MKKILLYSCVFWLFSETVLAQCDGSSSQCLGTQSYTVSPAPVGGHYSSGTVVTFCYTMTDYNQCNSNWFHTLNLTLGVGWDVSTLTAISVPTGCDGQGNWALYSSSTSVNTGLTFGPCFSYDSPLGNPSAVLDGIPGNNYGDNCATYVWTFCFSIQVAANCSNESLNVDATAIGDGTGGSWSSNTCPGIPFNMCNVTCNTCPLHITSMVTNPTCLDNNGSIILIADSSLGQVSFSWLPTGDTSSSLSGLSSGIYTVTVKDTSSCEVLDTFNLSYVNPVALSTESSNVSCYNFCDGKAFITATGGALPYTYDWSNGQTSSFDTTLCAGTYYITVTDANFCKRFDTVVVTQPAFYNTDFSYSPQLVCEGTTVTFTNLSSGSIEEYLWVFGDGSYSTDVNPTHLYTTPGVYTVTLKVQSSFMCYQIVQQIIVVHANLAVGISYSSPPYCIGQEVSFTDNSTGSPSQWNWNFGDGDTSNLQNPTHTYTSEGDYQVTVAIVDSFCGAGSASADIPVFDDPHPQLRSDTVLCGGEVQVLNANTAGASYLWSTGETTQSITFVMPGEDVTVWVQVNNNGCSGSDTVFFKNHCVMVVPSAFSPNNDGKNDLFRPLGSSIQDFDFVIYNRWGQQVFSKNSGDIHDGWDGTFNGQPQPVGVYIYILTGTFIDGQTFHLNGNITLVR